MHTQKFRIVYNFTSTYSNVGTAIVFCTPYEITMLDVRIDAGARSIWVYADPHSLCSNWCFKLKITQGTE